MKVELRVIDKSNFGKQLFDRCGKKQVPYLVDTNTQSETYESQDIINPP